MRCELSHERGRSHSVSVAVFTVRRLTLVNQAPSQFDAQSNASGCDRPRRMLVLESYGPTKDTVSTATTATTMRDTHATRNKNTVASVSLRSASLSASTGESRAAPGKLRPARFSAELSESRARRMIFVWCCCFLHQSGVQESVCRYGSLTHKITGMPAESSSSVPARVRFAAGEPWTGDATHTKHGGERPRARQMGIALLKKHLSAVADAEGEAASPATAVSPTPVSPASAVTREVFMVRPLMCAF